MDRRADLGLRRGEVLPDLSRLVATYVNPQEAVWSFDSWGPGRRGFWWSKHTAEISSRQNEAGEWIFDDLGRDHSLESLAESLKRARRLREVHRARFLSIAQQLRAVRKSYFAYENGYHAVYEATENGWCIDSTKKLPRGADTEVAALCRAWEERLYALHPRYAVVHNAFVCAYAYTRLPPAGKKYETRIEEFCGLRVFFAVVPDERGRSFWRMFMPVEFLGGEDRAVEYGGKARASGGGPEQLHSTTEDAP